ncbi:hypothetical protein CC79DRAFT_1332006 [Sarocladium strictum]
MRRYPQGTTVPLRTCCTLSASPSANTSPPHLPMSLMEPRVVAARRPGVFGFAGTERPCQPGSLGFVRRIDVSLFVPR